MKIRIWQICGLVIALVSPLSGCGRSQAPARGIAVMRLSAVCPEDSSAPIIVYAPGSRAVITRDPFHISYQDAEGRAVLEQVAPANSIIFPALTLTQPFGSTVIPDTSLYAPLSFEIGGSAVAQFPAGPWTGNQLTGADAGLQFAATRVLSAACDGGRVEMTLATSDPTGRTIELSLSPDLSGGAALQLQAKLIPDTGISGFSDSFTSGTDEEFFGFGGRHNALSQRGNTFPNWTEEENFTAGPLQPGVALLPGTGGDTFMFPNGPTAAYYPQAMFISSRPYGFLLENTELSRHRLAYASPDTWQISAASAQLRYTVAVGAAPLAIRTLTAINGRHRVPPDWAMGTALSRTVRTLSASSDNATTYSAKIDDDLAKMEQYGITPASYGFEGWETLSRDRVREVITELRRRGIHPFLYIRSFVGLDVAGTEPSSVFQEALAKGYLVHFPGSTLPFLHGSPFIVGVAGTIDFTNPEAMAWWRGRIREMFDLGADGFMQDFGETVFSGMSFANGESGLTMHNRYPTLYHSVTMAALDEYRVEHPERQLFFFTRAGFSGRPGSAAFEFSNFPGDETTEWGRASGLASIIPDMLNRGVGGAYGFNTDIGGYEDIHTPATTAELFTRWAQASALMPFFRVHNDATNGVRMPWDFDDATLARWRGAARLHARALPLIKQLWQEAQISGLPVTRPLWLVYPEDRDGYAQDQEFMLGDTVLVAPVVIEGATSRDIYFPRGCWQHGETGETFNGPGSSTVEASLDSLPYFFKCGTHPF